VYQTHTVIVISKKAKQAAVFALIAIAASGYVITRTDSRGVKPPPIIDPALRMPAEVQTFVLRSCADCHTNGTRWPWYGRIPPGSWLLNHDVQAARQAMNLSEWSTRNGRTAGSAVATLTAACADVESGRMPEGRYLWLHRDARPEKVEVQQFCSWAQGEIARLSQIGKAVTK
jgi:hypothetical protein